MTMQIKGRPTRLIPAIILTLTCNREEKFSTLLIFEDKRGKNGSVVKPLSNQNPFLLDRFVGQLHSPIVPAALLQSRPTRLIPMMLTLTQINMKENIPKRKCSANHKRKTPGPALQASNGPN
jgi:hypothetical protein